MNGDAKLPSFASPPVNEVVLSLQMKQTSMLSPHVGLFWNELRDQFPVLQEQPYLDPAYERFPAPLVPQRGLRLLQKPDSLRIWMVSKLEDRLIQAQPDRLIYNWRKVGDSPYPRYGGVRQQFVDAAESFSAFLSREQLGVVEPNQCEVTYVNHLPVGGGFEHAGALHDVFSLWRSVEGFAGVPEQAGFSSSYVISDNHEQCGRLHVSLSLGALKTTGARVLILTLVARGRPLGDGLTGALNFFDKGHEWIVRTFTDITTERMHVHWGRADG